MLIELSGHLNIYIHVFIRYNSTSKGYCCFLFEKNKIIVFKDVIFYEDHFGFPPATIIVSTTTNPCITLLIVPLLNFGATPPWLIIVDEFDTQGIQQLAKEAKFLKQIHPWS
jgi:hypothetical protein